MSDPANSYRILIDKTENRIGMLKSLPILCCLFLQTGYLFGQCPDRAALWKRLEFFRDSGMVPEADQLKVLLPTLDSMKKCHFQNDSTYVFLLQRIGIDYHVMTDEVNAFRYIKASLNVITANKGSVRIKPDQLARTYFNLSLIYDSLKLIPEHNNALDSFITVALKVNFLGPRFYDGLFERVRYCLYAGDYQQCISYSSIPDLIATRTDLLTKNNRDLILTCRLDALLALKNYAAADTILAAKMATALKEKDKNSLGALYGIAANIARGKEDFPLALADFRHEFDYSRNLRYTIGCAVSLNAIGYLYFEKRHDFRNALRYYRQALTYRNPTEAISIYDNIALLFAGERQYDSALFYFQQAFDQIAPHIDETTLLEGSLTRTINNMAEYVTTLILDKGDVLQQQYDHTKDKTTLQHAILVYKAADRLLNRLKAEQTDMTSRLFWRTNSHRLYEHGITTAWQLGDSNTVFYFLEKSRAVLLNDQLTQQRWSANEDILKEAQLKKNILYLQKELETTTGDSANNRQIQSDLFSAKQALTEQEQSIKQRNPLYYQNFLDTAFIKLADLRTYLIDNHQSMLEFYTGDSAIYTMLITPGHTYLNRIGKADYDSTIRSYMSYLSDPSRLNHDMPGYIRTAYHLYRLLFPVAAPNGRIIISPDGNYFPFESLVTNDSLQNPAWFLYDHPICYTYSSGYLLQTIQPDNPSPDNASPDNASIPKDFMGMAPVQYAAYQHLPALQGSDLSLSRIGSYFTSSDQFTAAQASRNRFLQNFSQYRIIQLYTHAIGNSGKEPTIYFADSSLSLSELIPENKPATRLIVLSACESGNGQFYQGEGIFSFNREFAALGIPASIVNCWSVDNKATYQLTELFYKYLSTGDPADLALQRAKKEFLQHTSGEQSLPYYWAAPLLTGSAVTIGQTPSRRHRFIPVLIGSLILLLFFVVNYFWPNTRSRPHRQYPKRPYPDR